MTDKLELRRLAEAATPGPWAAVNRGTKKEPMLSVMAGAGRIEVALTCTGDVSQETENSKTAFIAAANPATILSLLDEIAKLRSSRRTQMTDLAEQIARVIDPVAFSNELIDRATLQIAERKALEKAHAILALLPAREMPEGYVLVPKVALDWLDGSGPDHRGKWFGEVEDDLSESKYPRKYFWRSHFRKICDHYLIQDAMLSASPLPSPIGEKK